jgi:hypothetical protein
MSRHPKPPTSSLDEINQDIEGKKLKQRAATQARTKMKGYNNIRGHRGKQDHYLTDATIEDDMIAAIDFRKDIAKMRPLLEKLVSDKFDPTSFFSSVSKFAAAELASVAFTGEKEKNRLDALKHLLALGGHTATQKHEISRVDPNTEKEALMSIVRGAQKDLLAEGIEIVDDSEDYDK